MEEIHDGTEEFAVHSKDASTQCSESQLRNTSHGEMVTDIKTLPVSLKCPKNDNKENATSTGCCVTNSNKEIVDEEKVYDRTSSKRRRRTASLSPVCPVCGLTLRVGELKEHYEKEVNQLQDLNDPSSKSSLKRLKRFNSKKGKGNSNGKDNSENDPEAQASIERSLLRKELFSMIKSSRRLRQAKLLLATAPHLVQSEESSSDCRMVKCPVCDAPIAGTEFELESHVQRCLLKKEGGMEEEDSEEESIEEYTWAGQTRIRATSLLEGGLMACGGDPVKLQMTNEDEELDIDGDSQIQYGLPQYTEKDVIPCSADFPADNVAQDCIRAAISIDQDSTNSKETSRSRWSSENGECSDEVDDIQQMKSNEIEIKKDPLTTIKNLKEKLTNTIDQLQKERLKCLICMEGFNTPLVSIICWHVYCEECWLRTLGAKKLCPQCNTITSPSDLRRIYI